MNTRPQLKYPFFRPPHTRFFKNLAWPQSLSVVPVALPSFVRRFFQPYHEWPPAERLARRGSQKEWTDRR